MTLGSRHTAAFLLPTIAVFLIASPILEGLQQKEWDVLGERRAASSAKIFFSEECVGQTC